MAAGPSVVLDALQLDEELESLLLTRCEGICAHAGGALATRLQPELRALLRGMLEAEAALDDEDDEDDEEDDEDDDEEDDDDIKDEEDDIADEAPAAKVAKK